MINVKIEFLFYGFIADITVQFYKKRIYISII